MGSVLAHRLGGAEVIGDALQIPVVGKQRAFQGSGAYEETILASRIREILIRDAKKPEMVVRGRSTRGATGEVPARTQTGWSRVLAARRFAQEIAAINPAVEEPPTRHQDAQGRRCRGQEGTKGGDRQTPSGKMDD